MIRTLHYIIFLAVFFFSCHLSPADQKKENVIISIQPFSGITAEETNYVTAELQKVYPSIQLNKPIDLPAMAYNPQRKRYRADSLINWLAAKTAKGHITIGLTSKDISTTKGDIADWGVMGLAFCPGYSCVATTFRLSKKQKKDQLFKIAVHELGHTQGLPHCSVSTCFMRDAEGGNPTNAEKEFCAACKKKLTQHGWKLN